jgi:tetratricopeptide (TPR) repeat protein
VIRTLIAAPLLLALASAASAQDIETEFRNCTATARSDPAKAVQVANDWRVRGGGIAARQCLGLGYAGLERWQPAAEAFEAGAKEAAAKSDPRAADLWTQAGNAWLAAEDGVKARGAFDAAIATGFLSDELRGEVHLDRARAGVLLNDLPGARNDINQGLALVARDPFAWYLSAALAVRQGKMDQARTDIAKAVDLAPDDADVLVQAGTIAGTAGDTQAARTYYERAIKAAPNSEAATRAKAALESAPEQPAPE